METTKYFIKNLHAPVFLFSVSHPTNPDANMYGVEDCPALDVWDEWR